MIFMTITAFLQNTLLENSDSVSAHSVATLHHSWINCINKINVLQRLCAEKKNEKKQHFELKLKTHESVNNNNIYRDI